MQLPSVIENILSGDLTYVTAHTEESWHTIYEQSLASLDPLVLAVKGGALADRLAWVFHAGYQATMHDVFPFCPTAEWSAYLAAEDSTGQFEGTTLARESKGLLLSGKKSWVAASKHVQHLVVRIHADPEYLVVIKRGVPGITLSHRSEPSFLNELSQGFAAFSDVSVADANVFPATDYVQRFTVAEQVYVLCALNAFMLVQAKRIGEGEIQRAAMAALSAVEPAIGTDLGKLTKGAKQLDAATQETLQIFEPTIQEIDIDLAKRWQRDRRFVAMYTGRHSAAGTAT